MTKRDFKTRRELFRGKSRKKNFDSFLRNYEQEKPRHSNRAMVMLLILILMAVVIYYVLGIGF